MDPIKIEKDFRIPGTDYIVEAGDSILVVSPEDKAAEEKEKAIKKDDEE